MTLIGSIIKPVTTVLIKLLIRSIGSNVHETSMASKLTGLDYGTSVHGALLVSAKLCLADCYTVNCLENQIRVLPFFSKITLPTAAFVKSLRAAMDSEGFQFVPVSFISFHLLSVIRFPLAPQNKARAWRWWNAQCHVI